MSIKITSPIEGYTGKSVFGPTSVTFIDGVAEIDDLSAPLRAYLETKGYRLEDVHAGPFDPAAHNADDVAAHLAGLDRTDETGRAEYDRIVAAERAGKARTGVLKAVEKAEADAAAAEQKAQEEAAAQAVAAQAALDAQAQGGGAA
ncbi:MAG: hypothetical protein J0H73_14335 [Salana multivorans]|uniref:hypothetical protein n=1 Tax=Salana multivorans TaxID=120377 RepID=UPI0009695546|nr:hypothetical protein [Salana multivorans]MBN8883479.1 hypothetical protein [Salana multivorans]OJX98668.1 MAG: hypothetical protein BGO96_04630 [Micrococcales bacterium 73-15]